MNGMGNPGMMGAGNGPMMPRMTPPRPIMAPRTQYLPGRFVNSEADIVAGEVPMDGSISFFCTNDLSKIIIKQWNNNGILDTMTYSVDTPNNAQQQNQQTQQPQMPDPPPPPNANVQQAPDPMTELQASMNGLANTIETAFNNLAGNMQQALQSINDKLENYDHGQG